MYSLLLAEGAMLMKPLRLSATFRMHNSGPAPMRIRRIGLGHGGMYDWNGFSVGNHGEEVVVHANKTKKLELSYVSLLYHFFTISSLCLSLSLSLFCHTVLLYILFHACTQSQ